MRNFILLALMLFIACPAYADDAILYEDTAAICPVIVQADKRWKTLQIRRGSTACRINSERTLEILHRTFAAIAETKDKTEYESVYLGRIIYYEWLSNYLIKQALTDKGWSTETGKPADNSTPQALNAFIDGILSKPEILDRLNAVATPTGRQFTGVSCEKVLISGPKTKRYESDRMPEGKRVPYDAICWLALKQVH